MIRYILKRLVLLIPILLGVTVIVFTIIYIAPGDPILLILRDDNTPERYAAKAAELGLDKSYIEQLTTYIWNVVTKLDFGKSYLQEIPVINELKVRFPVSASLGLCSVGVMIIVGIPLGTLAAVKQNTVVDIGLTTLAMVMAAVPGFVLALLSMLIFCVKLRWLPLIGLNSFKAWILPVLTNAVPGIAFLTRMTRTTMLEVIRQDYIGTARAKGLKESVIIAKHALGNTLIPLTTIIGGFVGMTLAGSVIIETIFSIKGIGAYLTQGINGRDYPLVLGGVIVMAFLVCLINLLVDILYAFIDPRIKAQYTSGKKVRKTAAVKAKAESEVA